MTQDRIAGLFRKPPTLVTERLTLRKIRMSDAADFYEYASCPEVTKYLLWDPHPSPAYTGHYLETVQNGYRDGRFYDWAITLTDGGKMIGTCGYTTFRPEHDCAEIGYVLNPRFWGRGIATEAVRAVLNFAFRELDMNRVEAHFMEGNDRSFRVMQRCGMTFEGFLQQYMLVKGTYRTIGFAAVTRDKFPLTECYRRADEGLLRRGGIFFAGKRILHK